MSTPNTVSGTVWAEYERLRDDLEFAASQEGDHCGRCMDDECLFGQGTDKAREALDAFMLRYLGVDPEALRAENESLRVTLARIIAMCGVPPHCRCGRPNGLPAVVACARTALSTERAPATVESEG
jgi:hypothetical protein